MSEPVSVGFVGAGEALWGYLRELDRLVPRGDVAVGPICARRAETHAAIRRRRPAASLVTTPEEVLAAGVEIVVVLTPPASHVDVARLAIESGAHVLVEKPLGRSRAEGEALLALASERGLHVYASPFVHLSPTFRLLWTLVHRGEIGSVHSARGLYGNAGSPWAAWYHTSGAGPLPDMGIYNLKSLATLVGPVREVYAAEATAVGVRELEGQLQPTDPDVCHVMLRHGSGALSSLIASQAIQRYRRPGLELYGTEGTINLLGDDWQPRGLEMWRNDASRWQAWDAIDETWTWSDGLRELVEAVRDQRAPLGEPQLDLHLLEVLQAFRESASEHRSSWVASSFPELDLTVDTPADLHRVHDRTRPPESQLHRA